MKHKLYLSLIILLLLTSCSSRVDENYNPYLDLDSFPTTAYDPLYDESYTIEAEETTKSFDELIDPENTSCTLSFLGDLMVQDGILKDTYNAETKEYDFTIPFQYIIDDIKYADYTVLNLETTFGTGDVSGNKKYCAPDDLAYNLKDMGVDLINLANNHALDNGNSGIIRTIGVLDSIGMSHVGTNKSIEDYEKTKGVHIANVNGIKIGFISFTRYTSGISLPENNEKAVNVYVKDYNSNSQTQVNYEIINEQLTYAKENSDIVVALMHWGDKGSSIPSGQQTEVANYLITNGVKIIVGTHPHVLEPMLYQRSEEKTNDFVIVYSLGNSLTTQVSNGQDISSILYIDIKKENGITYIDDLYYEPITIIQRDRAFSPRYFVLNTQSSLNNLVSRENQNLLSLMTDNIVKRLRATLEKTAEMFKESFDYYIRNNEVKWTIKDLRYDNLKDIYNKNLNR